MELGEVVIPGRDLLAEAIAAPVPIIVVEVWGEEEARRTGLQQAGRLGRGEAGAPERREAQEL
ncbi:MAG: hypothetical protein U1E65_12125 [Myxococcota bacterium]